MNANKRVDIQLTYHGLGIVLSKLVASSLRLQNHTPLMCLSSPSSSPYRWLERRIGDTKGKGHRPRQEQFTGNRNEIRKPTVTSTILLTKDVRQINGLHRKTMIKYDCPITLHFLPPE